MDTHEELRSHLKIAALIAAAVIASLVIYLGAEEFIRARLRPFTGFAAVGPVQQLRFAFYGLAVIAVMALRFLRQIQLRTRPDDDRKTRMEKLQRASIVTLLLSEIPGVLGFVLFLLCGLNIDFYLLLFVSIFLVFMYYPRLSGWEDWLKG